MNQMSSYIETHELNFKQLPMKRMNKMSNYNETHEPNINIYDITKSIYLLYILAALDVESATTFSVLFRMIL